jgi:hypothetical protein
MPHNVGELPNSNVGDNRAQPRARDGGPAASQSLIDELEEAIAKHDLHRRAAVMRRLTDFFIVDGAGLSEEHVATFDDVMSRLIVAIDKSARAEFGEMLTRHPNAPKTSRILALDDEIAVAAPVLAHSRSLDDATLIETAKTKSQDHLFAITLRQSIGEAVTDVLVERGSRQSRCKVFGFRRNNAGHPLAGRCRARTAGLVTVRYTPAAFVEPVFNRDRRGAKAT